MMQSIPEKYCHSLLCIGVVCLPLVELYRSFFGGKLQLFGFAVEELLLLLWAGFCLIGGAFLAAEKKKKGALIVTLSWLGVNLIYLLLHGWNTLRFDASLMPHSQPGFFTEIYYVVRTYLAPTAVLLAAWLGEFPLEKLFSALRGALWVIALGVVIPCVLGISFTSYIEGNEPVAGGFFSWFAMPEGADPAAYTARGFFPRANVVGAALFGLVPIAAYTALKKGRVHDFLLLFFTGLASVMVGTKIGSLGFFLGLGAVLFAAAAQRLICKKAEPAGKNLAIALLILAAVFPLFLLSPGKALQEKREIQKETEERTSQITPEMEEILEETENPSDVITPAETIVIEDYLEEHLWDHFIDPWFPQLYPPEGDGAFWCRVVERDPRENQDSRRFKLELCQRIKERNQNSLDTLLGMGYTSGIPYAERDFIFQYYELGALGVALLIGPFFALFLWGAWKTLRSLFGRQYLLKTGVLCLSLFCFFATAYLAGHVFDTILSTYLVALTGACLARGGYDEA